MKTKNIDASDRIILRFERCSMREMFLSNKKNFGIRMIDFVM